MNLTNSLYFLLYVFKFFMKFWLLQIHSRYFVSKLNVDAWQLTSNEELCTLLLYYRQQSISRVVFQHRVSYFHYMDSFIFYYTQMN